MKSGASQLAFHCLPWRVLAGLRRCVSRQKCSLAKIFLSFSFFIAIAWLGGNCWAQSASEDSGALRGIVINSVTHEPIDRALVSSPDNRFATLTNSDGRFEFALPKIDPASDGGSDSNRPGGSRSQRGDSNRPYSLMARKPGFLSDPNHQGNNLRNDALKDLTLALTPEAVIAGTVTLPTSEAPPAAGAGGARALGSVWREPVHVGRSIPFRGPSGWHL